MVVPTPNLTELQCHEILPLEVLTLLVSKPTDDSVELAVGLLKEVGQNLLEVSSKAVVGKRLSDYFGTLTATQVSLSGCAVFCMRDTLISVFNT